MSGKRMLYLLSLILLTAFSTGAFAGGKDSGTKPIQRKKKGRFKTRNGAVLTVPARWYVTRRPSGVVFEEPDRQLKITLLELKGANGKAAIAKAWKKVDKEFSLKPIRTVSPPARDGWDEIVQITYQTPTKERKLTIAVAWGNARLFRVALISGKIAAFGRRSAQVNTILSSMKVPGVKEETFAGKKARKFNSKRLRLLTRFFESTLRKLRVPGGALAVIQDGRVVFKRGVGSRRKGGGKKVTTKTLFMIGSVTKALTTMMMARLVDEKKFGWDTPVTRVFPAFALGDASVTARCRMKHTVCACTGLPRQDMEFLFESRGATAESRMKLLSTMKPTTGFGETFQYSNLIVSAGGYVAAHAAFPKLKLGQAYIKAMHSRLLQPAGMKLTTFDFAKVVKRDHAHPHSPALDQKYVPIPLEFEHMVSSVGPAGAAWSNVEDMARFILLELGRGKTPKGKRIVSAANLLARWKPQIRMSAKAHYGMALITYKGRGIRYLGHGGGTLGFTSYMFFLPEHNAGLVLLTNGGGFMATRLVRRRFLELLFDGRKLAGKKLSFLIKQRKKALKKSRKMVDLSPPRSWLKKYVGTYRNPALGRIEILLKGKKGVLDAGEWQAPLGRLTTRDGVVKLVIGPPLASLSLLPKKQKKGRSLTLFTAQQKYVFVEQQQQKKKGK